MSCSTAFAEVVNAQTDRTLGCACLSKKGVATLGSCGISLATSSVKEIVAFAVGFTCAACGIELEVADEAIAFRDGYTTAEAQRKA